MIVCLVSQFLNKWCIRKKSTSPWAQMIGQGYISTLDMKCSLGHSALNILHSPPCFERLLWKLVPESQNQNTFKNPPCRLIFSYSDWKQKQKPSSDFFFLELTTREDSWEPSHRPSGPALMRNLSCFSSLHCAATTCKGPWRNTV